LFVVFERWFDVLEEGDRERIALVYVRNIAVKPSFCIAVGKEADVLEFPTEDYELLWSGVDTRYGRKSSTERRGGGLTVDDEDN
jgi:hypothetical protein